MQEDKGKFTIRVELPGLKPEDIDVSLQDGALVISGERQSEKIEKIEEGVEVHRQERFYGKFQRTLTLPKTEEAKPRKTKTPATGWLREFWFRKWW